MDEKIIIYGSSLNKHYDYISDLNKNYDYIPVSIEKSGVIKGYPEIYWMPDIKPKATILDFI